MEVELNEPDYERQYSAAAICVRVSRAMAMLDIGKTKLYELIEAGELETIRVGRRTLILCNSIAAFVARPRTESG